MEDYLSEREQIESLRSSFKEHAPWAIAGLLIALVGFVGYQQYTGWRTRQSVTAAQKYNAALEALSRADKAGAVKIATELKTDFGRTPYGDLAALAVTRFEVETNDLTDAAKRLEELMNSASDPELKTIARLRLARVQRAAGKPDVALATLAGAAPGTATPAFADVRGDILADKGDKKGALDAWHEALEAKMPGMINKDLIDLKIAALGSPAAMEASAPAPATPAATVTAAPKAQP